jgi:hypothetical protein
VTHVAHYDSFPIKEGTLREDEGNTMLKLVFEVLLIVPIETCAFHMSTIARSLVPGNTFVLLFVLPLMSVASEYSIRFAILQLADSGNQATEFPRQRVVMKRVTFGEPVISFLARPFY